ncbi:helix-turn-helix transcriptional regulator [Pseudooceanicola spongiae]|jgi:predicted transcriptional regulator|uniref:Helix-turn-helix domain-containing protein n=1 Tax=Pseudooceanicola spongiae TaxID=2613965 RepID=A0A7L9WM40_9RHOB|nr:helix-turn-helix transcriptional regulator [Pseudooceanicola spongiae]QOL80446.1 helix-turn-helix domain-containing protein [Pseudooceanicola spongiae]
MLCISGGMKSLSQYRADNAISQRAFAERLGVSQSLISRIEHGTVSPSLSLAVKIEFATEGNVTAVSLAQAKDAA